MRWMKGERQYRIVKSNLGFQIYKKIEKNGFLSLWFLGSENKWVLNRNCAKTFYHREDALSVLQIMKAKDGKDAD